MTALTRALWLAAALTGCATSDVSRELGARCDDRAECDDRCLRPSAEFPGGLCSLACEGDRDCPDRGRCVAEMGGVCLFGCAAEAGCEFLGEGWTCQVQPAFGGGEVEVCRGG